MKIFFIVSSIVATFFILGTATSMPDEQVEYDCIVTYEDNAIIIKSESNVDVVNAWLNLVVNIPSVEPMVFTKRNYSLDGLAVDTIPKEAFISISDSLPVPIDGIPSLFEMEFYRSDTIFTKTQDF